MIDRSRCCVMELWAQCGHKTQPVSLVIFGYELILFIQKRKCLCFGFVFPFPVGVLANSSYEDFMLWLLRWRDNLLCVSFICTVTLNPI